jgi:hypothetical protein
VDFILLRSLLCPLGNGGIDAGDDLLALKEVIKIVFVKLIGLSKEGFLFGVLR